MNLIIPQMFKKPIHLNPLLDVIETAAIVRHAERNGVVEIGGGSPKNFYLQTQPTIHQMLLDKSKGGHDFCLQLTTDSPHWGGLSGCSYSEGVSWGKFVPEQEGGRFSELFCDATIAWPLVVKAVMERME